MIRVHDAPGSRVVTATLDDGRVYRVVVPSGLRWRQFCTLEEYVCGIAGVPVARGMYG